MYIFYLRMKSQLIRNKKKLQSIGFVLGILLVILDAIFVFSSATNRMTNYFFAMFGIISFVGFVFISLLYRIPRLSDLERKYLLLNFKLEDEKINTIINEITKFCREKRDYITVYGWYNFERIIISYEGIIDEPVLLHFYEDGHSKIIFENHDEGLSLYPMTENIKRLYLNEFLFSLVKRGLRYDQLESLFFEIV